MKLFYSLSVVLLLFFQQLVAAGNKTTVHVCCDHNYAYNVSAENCNPIPAETLKTVPQLLFENGTQHTDITELVNPVHYNPQCDILYLDPEVMPENKFEVLLSGKLRGTNKNFELELNQYCILYSFREMDVDGQLTANENLVKLGVLACNNNEQYASVERNSIESIRVVLIPTLLGFSIFFMFVTIGLHLYIPRLRDLQGLCLIGYLTSLAFTFIFLVSIQVIEKGSEELCRVMGYSTNYFVIAAFFWLLIMIFNLWKRINWYSEERRNEIVEKAASRDFFYRLGVGFGGPAILMCCIALITLGMGREFPFAFNGNEKLCWYRDDTEVMMWIYGPILALLLLNLPILGITIYRLWSNRSTLPESEIEWFTPHFRMFAFTFFCWIFEIITYFYEPHYAAAMIFDTIMSLQGLGIFVIYICRRHVFQSFRWFSRTAEIPYTKDELSNSTV